MFSSGKNTIVLVNRPEKHFMNSLYFKNIKAGVDMGLEGSDYQIFFAQQDEHLADIMSSKKQRIAGIIAISPSVNDKSIKLLEVKEGEELAALVPVGRVKKPPAATPRKAVDEIRSLL